MSFLNYLWFFISTLETFKGKERVMKTIILLFVVVLFFESNLTLALTLTLTRSFPWFKFKIPEKFH